MATKGERRNPAKGKASSATAGAEAPVLDTSGEGSPFFASGATAGLKGTVPGDSATSPNGDVVVEVELAPGTGSVLAALTQNMAAFIGSTSAVVPQSAGLAGVLLRFRVQDARPVFSRDRIAADAEETLRLRQAVAFGATTPDRVSARERLPALAQFVRLRFPPDTSARSVTDALKRLPEVVRAVAVPRALPPTLVAPIPADPLIGDGTLPLIVDPATGLESQWYLHRTRVTQAWRYARGANVVIADLDWGFRSTHQDLQPAIELTYNAVDGGADVTQGHHAAHGTAVLGIAGGRSNGKGIAGYAPEAALWAIQGDSAPGAAVFEEPWAEAIDFARRTDARGRRKVLIVEVQTGAFGNYEQVPSVHRAIRAAIADGCVVCVAAGNGDRAADRTDDGDPFDPTGSILVGATAYDEVRNKRASFSNFGSRVVVSAPGDAQHDLTCGQISDTAYRNAFGGTSGATPKVAGHRSVDALGQPGPFA